MEELFAKYLYYIRNFDSDKIYVKMNYKKEFQPYLKKIRKKEISFIPKDGFQELDLLHVSNCNTHLISADMNFFNFSHMKEESNQENNELKGIIWGNYRNRKGKYYRDHAFNLGDTVYIYYTNPTHGENRILIQTTIINDGYYELTKDNKIIKKSPYANQKEIKDGVKIITELDNAPAIILKLTGMIQKEQEKNFTYEKLKKAPYHLTMTQTKRYLTQEYLPLINDLKKATSKVKNYDELVDRFNLKCLLNQKDKKEHPTFLKQNGLLYYEVHHLIERHAAKNLGEKPEELILELKKYMKHDISKNQINQLFLTKELDKEFNLYTICANCHNQIHYGMLEERRKMIQTLYQMEDHKPEIDTFLQKKGVIPGKEFDFILCLYGIYNSKK